MNVFVLSFPSIYDMWLITSVKSKTPIISGLFHIPKALRPNCDKKPFCDASAFVRSTSEGHPEASNDGEDVVILTEDIPPFAMISIFSSDAGVEPSLRDTSTPDINPDGFITGSGAFISSSLRSMTVSS